LVASSRTNREGLAAFTSRFGGERYVDYRQVLDRRDIDAVCIALPHHLYLEAVERAAQAGKHILLEKLMAPSLEECDRILEVVARGGVKLMLARAMRFIPACLRAKALLTSGQIDHMERPAHLSQNSVGCSREEQSHMRKEAGHEEAYHIRGPR